MKKIFGITDSTLRQTRDDYYSTSIIGRTALPFSEYAEEAGQKLF
jgi:hypothetical protein